MFYLSNGPLQISTPAARNAYLFKDTPVFNSTGDTEKNPQGELWFCTFQTQLYFISARMMWRRAEHSGGDLRARRGNGAENSSQSKGRCCSWARKWGREAAPTLVTLLNGVQSPCPWGGRGGQPADTWPFTATNPSLMPPPPQSSWSQNSKTESGSTTSWIYSHPPIQPTHTYCASIMHLTPC